MQGLAVSRVVNVTVSFAPIATPLVNFDTLLIMGDSDVIDTGEVMREYNLMSDVARDFGTTAPEYQAALLYFSQLPPPATLFIGRWAAAPTKGSVVGGFLSNTQKLLLNWTSVTNGGFKIAIDGLAPVEVTALNFSGATNLNGVASIISTALTANNATCVWNGQQFIIRSNTTGPTSMVGPLTPPAAGTDISGQMLMTAALIERTAQGQAIETPVASLVRVDGRGWYACMFAASRDLTDAEHIANAAYIEAAEMHLYGVTSASSNIVDPLSTADLASQLMLAEYFKTVGQWSTNNKFAIASFFGRAFTVDFEGSNTTITMKFKVQPGVTPEVLSASQANAIEKKRFNVYVVYENGVAIVEQGVVCGPAWFDEIHGTDWLANRLQTDIFNILYQLPKVPQTNPGIQILVAGADGGLSQGVTNGLIAPGVWRAGGFGTLQYGEYLAKGWYTWANSVDNQPQAEREARIAPLIQCAIKLAGAVHHSDVLVNVNR
jgi:Protein of unknown function (DUF3383)